MRNNRMMMLSLILIMLALIIILKTGFSDAVNVSNDYDQFDISQMPETRYYEQYSELSAPSNTVVVYPILTQTAYAWKGIHDFYTGRCDACSTVKIDKFYDPIFSTGANSFRILEFLGYDVIDDIAIDKDPNILKKYNSVVLLHNEFVTQNEFFAITSHPNVIYLYPGAFNSKVKINYDDQSITLQRGPAFPESDVKSGFDWTYDNSNISDNTSCENWSFEMIYHGYMLNCTPEYLIQDSDNLLKEIKKLSEI
ncbi:MAG: hypothetical protein K8Q89_05415 [Nitrosarchaeum sp.]|nr:hypothetical protein [Nitrosarchaeum sp.]